MKPKKLSILLCSVPSRLKEFSTIEEICRQARGLPVEVLYLGDNNTVPTGEKRNFLKKIAIGRYVGYADDDDNVHADYVNELLAATELDKDVITYNVYITQNGKPKEPVYYSLEYPHDRNGNGVYYRIPNHLMFYKREIAMMADFPPITMGEDSAWAKQVRKFANSQHHIDKFLYTYIANNKTSESIKNIGLRYSK
jgi:hypothetical protein